MIEGLRCVAEFCRHPRVAVVSDSVAGRELEDAAIGVACVGEALGVAEEVRLGHEQSRRIGVPRDRSIDVGREAIVLAEGPKQTREILVSRYEQRIPRDGLAIERDGSVELAFELQSESVVR